MFQRSNDVRIEACSLASRSWGAKEGRWFIAVGLLDFGGQDIRWMIALLRRLFNFCGQFDIRASAYVNLTYVAQRTKKNFGACTHNRTTNKFHFLYVRLHTGCTGNILASLDINNRMHQILVTHEQNFDALSI